MGAYMINPEKFSDNIKTSISSCDFKIGSFRNSFVPRLCGSHRFSIRAMSGKIENESNNARRLIEALSRDIGRSVDAQKMSFPNENFSMSHADGFCVAVGANAANGIGVDFEPLSRTIKPEMIPFYLTRKEVPIFSESRPDWKLALWTIKEAVFKSHMENDQRVLRDYEIIEYKQILPSQGLARFVGQNEVIYFDFIVRRFMGGILAVAVRKEIP